MPALEHDEQVAQPARRQHMVAQVIAGPETAARLGVAVGTVIEARHVETDLDTGEQLTQLGEDVISPDEAQALIDAPAPPGMVQIREQETTVFRPDETKE